MGIGNTKTGKCWKAIVQCVNFKEQHRCKEQMYGYKPGMGCGMNWEIGTDIYTYICHIYIYLFIYI